MNFFNFLQVSAMFLAPMQLISIAKFVSIKQAGSPTIAAKLTITS